MKLTPPGSVWQVCKHLQKPIDGMLKGGWRVLVLWQGWGTKLPYISSTFNVDVEVTVSHFPIGSFRSTPNRAIQASQVIYSVNQIFGPNGKQKSNQTTWPKHQDIMTQTCRWEPPCCVACTSPQSCDRWPSYESLTLVRLFVMLYQASQQILMEEMQTFCLL